MSKKTKKKKDKKLAIKFLGKNLKKYKKELRNLKTDTELLDKYGLPKLTNPDELAAFLSIDYPTLRKYCVAEQNVVSSEFPYRRFALNKKSGGKRIILAPKKELKSIQDKIYHEILKKIEPSNFAHGFRKNYSIVSNAKIHLNAEIIYNLDLKNFFPSIKFYRVLYLFKDLGYSGLISSLLAALCTYPPRKFSKKKGFWMLTKRKMHFLPQGAPTSPALSNLVCINLDKELNSISNEFDFRYSRYADDLTFSSASVKKICEGFDNKIIKCIKRNHFRINHKKKKFSRLFKHRRVTGIIVHKDYLALPRIWIRRLRAAIHEFKTTTLDKNDPYYVALVKNIEGRCAYAIMVNREKYSHFYDEFKNLTPLKAKGFAKFCPFCGGTVEDPEEKHCKNCGKSMYD